ncbi:MAG: nitrilase-related carbon-nitrogen hydrolase [Opitutales bacterium]
MKIALAQMDVKQAGFIENIQEAKRLIKKALEEKAELIVFPEMFLSGFHYGKNKEFLLKNRTFLKDELSKLAKEHNIAICGSTCAIDDEDNVYNRLYFFDENGEILAQYDKIHLFTLFNEDKHIKNGTQLISLDYKGLKFGLSICYDLRFPEMFRAMTFQGVDAFILPAGWPHPRLAHWQHLIRARAIENQAYFIAVNQGGTENFGMSDINYFGSSSVIDPWGETLAQAKLDEPDLLFAEIDPALAQKVRNKLNALQDAYFYKNQ